MINSYKRSPLGDVEIIVAGGMNRDYFIYTKELPKPGETLFANSVETFCGGKGLNAACASALMKSKSNVKVSILGTRGKDPEGDDVLKLYNKMNIDTQYLLTHNNLKTGLAFVTVAENGENAISVFAGSNWSMHVDEIKKIRINPNNQLICLANFEINIEAIDELFSRIKGQNGLTILNPSPMLKLSDHLASNTDIIIVNENELTQFIELHRSEMKKCNEYYDDTTCTDRNMAISTLVRALRLGVLIVTLGAKGCQIWRHWGDEESDKLHDFQPTEDRVTMRYVRGIKNSNVIDTTGAGDCFAGSLTTCLAEGIDIQNSAMLANMMAGHCVSHKGASSSYFVRGDVIPDVHSEGKNVTITPYQSRNYIRVKETKAGNNINNMLSETGKKANPSCCGIPRMLS